jgi:hypothetical protein
VVEVLANQVNLVCNDLVAQARSRPIALFVRRSRYVPYGRFLPVGCNPKGAVRRPHLIALKVGSDPALHV